MQCKVIFSSYLKFLSCSFNIFSKVCLLVYTAAITALERALLADMHNVQYELNEQKCQDLAFFCHWRPYDACAAAGVAETAHGCKTQD